MLDHLTLEFKAMLYLDVRKPLPNEFLVTFRKEFLDNLPFDMYLTGSRFFGNSHPMSDWDFVCGSISPQQEAEILALGFELELSVQKGDNLFGGVNRVFKYVDLGYGVAYPFEVHILEVSNFKMRVLTQRVIKYFFQNGYSSKSDNAHGIWSMAELIAAQGISIRSVAKSILLSNPQDTEISNIKEDFDSNSLNKDLNDSYDEENDWEDCFEWVMEAYEAEHIRTNLNRTMSFMF